MHVEVYSLAKEAVGPVLRMAYWMKPLCKRVLAEEGQVAREDGGSVDAL